MNAIRFIFIGLFLFAISLKSAGQNLLVDFSYNKSTRLFEIKLTNNTERQMVIMNYKFSGGDLSHLVYSVKTPEGIVENRKVLLWDELRNTTLDFRPLSPHETMHISRSIYNDSRQNKIVKARLILAFVGWDDSAGKITSQECEKEILINE